MYAGEVAESLEDGFAITRRIGDDALSDRVEQAVADLSPELAAEPPGVVFDRPSCSVRARQSRALRVEDANSLKPLGPDSGRGAGHEGTGATTVCWVCDG